MSEPENRIRITPQELGAKSVDEALAQQMSFGMPTPQKGDRKAAWYYQPWFVLMLAGALGGFAAWALIEPWYDDYPTLVGNVESVDPLARFPGAAGVEGRMTVSGTTIWFRKPGARMNLGDGEWKDLVPASFREGQVVSVMGPATLGPGGAIMEAFEVEIRPGDSNQYPPMDFRSYGVRSLLLSPMVFMMVAGCVGLAIGLADGLVSRAYGRATVCGLVGLGMGLGVGLVAAAIGQFVYMFLHGMVQGMNRGDGPTLSTGAFIVQMMSRGLAWALTGVAMGMGQGVALRSKKLFLNGLIGGVVGSLIGGLLFDPIDYVMDRGETSGSANSSRAVGFVVIGLFTGLMVGIVELIAREAWLKMLAGPLAGKEFVLYKDPTSVGSSPKREIYLFKDPEVEPTHALIHRAGEGYEIEDQKSPSGTYVNGRKVSRQRLQNQDQIRVGQTVLLFTMKED